MLAAQAMQYKETIPDLDRFGLDAIVERLCRTHDFLPDELI
jgi:hypothetical protein